ncbi:MAG: SDR family oxidoreductase, partial [Deltaproteobacteria bacterium]|nr:SDR family oxidoreductase [Deltaproteobacteria bacterium]
MANPQRVLLLTGGTGFLGWYLAQLVLRRSDRALALLVRADDETAARRRVRELFVTRLGSAAWARWRSRIHVLPGDVTAPDFGIGEARMTELSERVETIFHSAA